MIEAEPPSKVPGVNPVTVVDKGLKATVGEMEDRVRKTQAEHGDLLQEYHKIWYGANHTWCYTFFLGVGMMKSPNDLWAYQDVIAQLRPKTIIETGSYAGGSALWFAMLMDMLQIDGGRVFTIDYEDHRQCSHPRITFLAGDSTNPALRDAIMQETGIGVTLSVNCDDCGGRGGWLETPLDVVHDGPYWQKCSKCEGSGQMLLAKHPEPILVSLDADHSAEHVFKELELYAPMCKVGDYLVVEDTNISWDTERGARGGIEDYVNLHPNEWRQDPLCERWLLTMHPGGWLQRMAECRHG